MSSLACRTVQRADFLVTLGENQTQRFLGPSHCTYRSLLLTIIAKNSCAGITACLPSYVAGPEANAAQTTAS
jgi:hypothetical protein